MELLLEAKAILLEQGMADMDEYGDMLKWGLPKKDGWCRNLHVFHPGFCSFSDAYRGTIHFHGGAIRGHILLGGMEHTTYDATADEDGDRFYDDRAYTLRPRARIQDAGTGYELDAMVPHWIRPTALTLTYFEEEDTERMGDLIEPETEQTDEHVWTQEMADGLLADLLTRIDQAIQGLDPVPLPR